MPSTLASLLLFVAFITPGLCLLLVRETRQPQREASALRETAILLLGGVICDLAALGLFAAWRIRAPQHTPDVGRLVRGDTAYLRQEYVPIAAWAIGTLLVACVIAALVAMLTDRLGYLLHRFQPIQYRSAWHLMLQDQPNAIVYCGCALDDGSWLGGYLRSSSTSIEETPDRDLVLVGELTLRPAGTDKAVVLDEQVAIVSARNLRYLTVTYLDSHLAAPAGSLPASMAEEATSATVQQQAGALDQVSVRAHGSPRLDVVQPNEPRSDF